MFGPITLFATVWLQIYVKLPGCAIFFGKISAINGFAYGGRYLLYLACAHKNRYNARL